MNEINCENALMAKMAEIDGEEISISAELINLHLKNCANCRKEIEQLQVADVTLKKMERREQTTDLWTAIEARIEAKSISPINWKPFALCGVILVAYKLLEMLPAEGFGLAFKLVPFIFIVALFTFLKENPFKINEELALGEIKI